MKKFFNYNDDEILKMIRDDNSNQSVLFTIIYTKYSNKLRYYCVSKFKNDENIDDLLQDVWANFHKMLKNSNKEIFLPQTLFTIVNNLIIDNYKSSKSKSEKLHQASDYENIQDEFDLLRDIENKDLIKYILDKAFYLQDDLREIFFLKWINGSSYVDIAAMTKSNPVNIRNKSMIAIEYIKKMIKPIIKDLKNKGVNNGK